MHPKQDIYSYFQEFFSEYHTYAYIYIYMLYICVCICIYMSTMHFYYHMNFLYIIGNLKQTSSD